MSQLTYAEAMAVGLIQGVTGLSPVSRLGRNVLIPNLGSLAGPRGRNGLHGAALAAARRPGMLKRMPEAAQQPQPCSCLRGTGARDLPIVAKERA
jgi:hypothetical protein